MKKINESKKYVPITLDAYLNESKSITLKRGYGERKPVVVGANAPLRNQILSFVSEGKVSKVELKRFIAGLNETSKNPVAAANMWIKRNAKFFVTETKSGVTYYKLSTIGKRLANRLAPVSISEKEEEKNIRTRLSENRPSDAKFEDFDEDEYEAEAEPGSYDFVDRKKGYERPGIYDVEEGLEEGCDDDEEVEEKMDEDQKARIKKIIENIKSKRNKKLNEKEEEVKEKLNEEDEEADELTFDDLDLDDDEEKEEGEKVDDEEKEEGEKVDDADADEVDADEVDAEDGVDVDDTEVEKVEITEFVITVDDVDEAIGELAELDVTGEQVVDEEGEAIEDQIKVKAEDWDALRGWLEEKGVDIEEMFGGEIEVEDDVDGKNDLEGGEVDDLEDADDLVDLEGGDDLDIEVKGAEDLEGGDDLDLDLDGDAEGEEFSLDLEDDVEESVTGMEREEKEKTPNLVQGKEVTITIK